jgi:hypothetical protein
MARQIADGEVRIYWVSSISSEAAPTVAEITGGTELTGFLSSLDTPLDGEQADTSALDSAFNTSVPGTFGGGATGTFYRDDTTDTAWTTLVRGTAGFIVVRRFGGSSVAIAISDSVEVWPATVITRSSTTLDRNNTQMFSAEFSITSEPTLNAVVA